MRNLFGGVLFCSCLAALLVASTTSALPRIGALRSAAKTVDADDRAFDLRSINGRPILIVYEDKDSSSLNQSLKNELAVLARGDKYRSSVALVPVANVEGYDYWPIRGFVKSSIRSESSKFGTTIYCDWDGSFRSAIGLRNNTSSVVLIGKNARILFAYEGAMPKNERARLIGLLRDEVESSPSTDDRADVGTSP